MDEDVARSQLAVGVGQDLDLPFRRRVLDRRRGAGEAFQVLAIDRPVVQPAQRFLEGPRRLLLEEETMGSTRANSSGWR